tara:strand:- start:39 stop:422 length:384 start_codon:yes stop_codon:yes gene_type:complete
MPTWKYFSNEELICKGTGEYGMYDHFMYKLDALREELGRPLIITSAYRHPAHNSAIGGAPNSPHTLGRAVDIQCMGGLAYDIMQLAFKHGMTGIGVSQRGNHDSRFLHLDDLTNGDDRSRPWVWSYK